MSNSVASSGCTRILNVGLQLIVGVNEDSLDLIVARLYFVEDSCISVVIAEGLGVSNNGVVIRLLLVVGVNANLNGVRSGGPSGIYTVNNLAIGSNGIGGGDDALKVIAVVYDTVNNELNITNVKTASTVAAKAVTLTGLSAKTIEGASETVTVAASPATAKPGTTVTLTATVSNTGIADKDTTVVVKGDKIGNVTIVVKKGKTTGSATFTMPTSNVEFTFVSATAK